MLKKLAFLICENKGTDQLRGNRAADQSFCFAHKQVVKSLNFLNLKFQASNPPVVVQPRQCWTWSVIPKTGFPMMRLV